MQSKPEQSKKLHLPFLDGIRAVAALYVVVNHVSSQLVLHWPKDKPSLDSSRLGHILKLLLAEGHTAVTAFIILSGFCLMLPVASSGVLKGGALNFFKRRARRILPPYYIALLFSILVVLVLQNPRELATLPKDTLLHLLLVHDMWVQESNRINAALWSVAVECRIYLFFPLMVLAWRKWGGLRTTLFLLAVSLPAQYALKWTPINPYAWGTCLHYFGLFGLGMLTCDLASRRVWESNPLLERIFQWPTPLVFFVLWALLRERGPFFVRDIPAGLAFASFLILLCRYETGQARRFLSSAPMVYIGTFAYSIYLIHRPILDMLEHWVINRLDLAAVPTLAIFSVLCVAVVLPVSRLFFWCFERPFLNTKPPVPGREPATAPVLVETVPAEAG